MLRDPETLLTVTEAARRLRLSELTVRRRIASGDLAAVRLGSGKKSPIRIVAAELEEFIHHPERKP
jgi:excisionase family DNA binding protein